MRNKEWVLNIAFNRWQFNRPKYVGKLAEAIRRCAPKSVEEWKRYYFRCVRPTGQMLGKDMQEHLREVGRRLYVKVSEQLKAEVEAVTEKDCVEYVHEVIIHRTFEGYVTEKKTIYEQVERALGEKLQPAPDEWDRRYNVDFFIPIGDKAMGIQIKPVTYSQTPEVHKWQEYMRKSHERFQQDRGGRVFIIFSVTEKGGGKRIWNEEIVEQICAEIKRLREESG